jgi:hypothetical protein
MRDLKERQSPWRAITLAKAGSPPHEMGRGLETPFIDLELAGGAPAVQS